VDPVPDAHTFERMYAKSAYHDCHYAERDTAAYAQSARLLKQYVEAGGTVLDFGCGFGHFLRALKEEGFAAFGVEFDIDAARFAAHNAGCEVVSVEDFFKHENRRQFDVLHLGDVLEHLPDPEAMLKRLLAHLKPGGLLFVEGPLEVNPSPVYWASSLFGSLKHWLRPDFVGAGKPTHLFRTGSRQQLAFFYRADPGLMLQHWQVYETGWPYAGGGKLKRVIAGLAIGLGGKRLFGVTFGNRFCGIFGYQRPSDGMVKTGLIT
jgi:SAM-dependent methyltransferase